MNRCLLLLCLILVPPAAAQDHDHHHGDDDAKPVERPRVFLDKSPRIVAYQLKRLSNARLLLVETATDDPKYIPVFSAILLRPGMARRNLDDALAGLTTIRGTDATTELLTAMKSLSGDSGDSGDQRRVGRQLSRMLVELPTAELTGHAADLRTAMAAKEPILSAAGSAGLIVSGMPEEAWQQAMSGESGQQAWLAAVGLVPSGPTRDALRDRVVQLLTTSDSSTVKTGAITALAEIKSEQADSFRRLAPYVADSVYRAAAVNTLLQIPGDQQDPQTAGELVGALVRLAEETPAAERTADDFLDAMQLADGLLQRLPVDDAARYRERLREITVRVVRLRTVEEEMRYDQPFFAVEAGRPVQVILDNEDLMPHNLVITSPGQLKEVAMAAAELGTAPGADGRMYVPEHPDVMFATSMVNAGRRERLTFTAPAEPGEYPYVCTFPRHWMRMYGVMVVVPDLDEWQRNPTTPKDPLGNNRSFVNSWRPDDFPQSDLPTLLQGRSPSIGARLFKEATCLSCHQMNNQGGRVGPALDDVLKRLNGDHHSVLREILEPSYRIDPKYAVRVIIDAEGRTTSGIVTAEDRKSISVLVNPESPEPVVIQKKDIDDMIPSATSMMPKALLDKFTRDEIMEILSYITGGSG